MNAALMRWLVAVESSTDEDCCWLKLVKMGIGLARPNLFSIAGIPRIASIEQIRGGARLTKEQDFLVSQSISYRGWFLRFMSAPARQASLALVSDKSTF